MEFSSEERSALRIILDAARKQADSIEELEKAMRKSDMKSIADQKEIEWKRLMAACGTIRRFLEK